MQSWSLTDIYKIVKYNGFGKDCYKNGFLCDKNNRVYKSEQISQYVNKTPYKSMTNNLDLKQH